MHSYLTLRIALKVKFKVTNIKPIYDFLLVFNSNYVPNLHCFDVMATIKCTYSLLTLNISLKVKFKVTKMKPIYDFILVSNSNYVPNMRSFSKIATCNVHLVNWPWKLQSRSNSRSLNQSPYMTFYKCSIVTMYLSWTVSKLQPLEDVHIVIWPWKFHSRSNWRSQK